VAQSRRAVLHGGIGVVARHAVARRRVAHKKLVDGQNRQVGTHEHHTPDVAARAAVALYKPALGIAGDQYAGVKHEREICREREGWRGHAGEISHHLRRHKGGGALQQHEIGYLPEHLLGRGAVLMNHGGIEILGHNHADVGNKERPEHAHAMRQLSALPVVLKPKAKQYVEHNEVCQYDYVAYNIVGLRILPHDLPPNLMYV